MKNFLLPLLLIGCPLSSTLTARAQSPTITSPLTATTTVGHLFTYQFEAVGATSLAATDLPPGLTFDSALSAIVGTPTTTGTFEVGLVASNASGNTLTRLSLRVQPVPLGPTIISATSATVRSSQPFDLQVITQGGSPALRLGTVPVLPLLTLRPTGIVNIATRTSVGTFDNVLLGGFVITGNSPKKILIRVIGPSLTNFGIPNALPDPTLELRNEGGALLLSNDDWRTDQEQDIIDTVPPQDDRESAIVTFLDPGKYTAIVRGKANTTGKAVVEVYDLGTVLLTGASNSGLAQVSTRSFVNTGDDVMIGGLIISGSTTRVIVRGIGPSLTGFGIANALANPTLELINGSGSLIASNDDWRSTQEQEIIATGVQPTDDRESAIVGTLSPGPYTAIVRGKGDTTGVALVEGYVLPDASPAPLSENVPVQLCFTSDPAHYTRSANGVDLIGGFPGDVFLRLDSLVGLISGVGTSDTSLSVGLTVRDGNVTASSTLQLTSTSDAARPVIISSSRAILVPGEPFSYTIVAPSSADPSDPTIFRFIGTLPPGLTFNAATGTISGVYTPLRTDAHSRSHEPNQAGGIVLGSIQLFGTNSHGTATVELRFLPAPSGVGNISTRTKVLTDEKVLIGGFIITGNLPKVVIVRAIGPSTGISGVLEDPTLTLLDGAGHLVVNDNWKSDQEQVIRDTGLAPGDDRESAIVIALNPGRYTATVAGKNGATGIALVAVDDLGTPSLNTSGNAKLAQISTRGFAGIGDDVMIGGFIIRRVATRIVVRAIGPSLSAFGVSGALPDPTLEIKNASGATLIGNDDWKQGQPAELQKAGLAPSDSHESALITTLPEGHYTAIVSGKGGATGVALVEVYALE